MLLGNKRNLPCVAIKVVVIEEAAEVMEHHILASLAPSTQHLILIGDHQQLRPKAQLWEMQAGKACSQLNIASLAEHKLVKACEQHVVM